MRILSWVKLSSEPFLLFTAIVTGIATGLAAVGFKMAINLVSDVGLHQILHAHGWLRWVLGIGIPAVGGVLVSLSILLLNRGKRGHGVPDVMEQVGLREGYVTGKVAWLAPLNASIVIGTGNSAGPEGPVVHAGAGIGSFLGRYSGMSTPRVKALIMCGCGAAIAAMYNAPIAGTLFALEVIAGEFNSWVLSLTLIASVAASVVSQNFFGASPAFHVTPYSLVTNWELVGYAVLGMLCGLLAHAYNRGIHHAEEQFAHLKSIPAFWRPALGGAIVGLVGLIFWQVLGRGEETIEVALKGADYGVLLLAGLSLLKILTTSITLGSGQPGGVFTPALFVGATAGGSFGMAMQALFGGAVGGPGAYALVGMGAVLGGSMRAPITAVVLLFELTGDYHIILPLMLAAGASYLLVSRMHPESIYTQTLAEKGVDLQAGRSANLLRTITVSEAMTTTVDTVASSATLGDVVAKLQATHHSGFPVMEGDRVVGVVTLGDIRRTSYEGRLERSVSEVMSRQLVIAHPDETLHLALVRLSDRGVGRLLVLDDVGSLVGVLTRTDTIKAYYRRQMEVADPLGAG